VMFVLISANIINALFNWFLISGHAGFPALGVRGSALSTCLARCYMAGSLAICIWWFERKTILPVRDIFARPEWDRIRKLVSIGSPAATQIVLEIGAFSAAGVLAGQLSSIALAAHQIALNAASVSYMVPLGISSAAAVSVGQAIGAKDWHRARRTGYLSIYLGALFMLASAAMFIGIPGRIIRVYSTDASVLHVGVGLLAWAALFQLFDGIQTVATGTLRGTGETRTPMLANLGAYWLCGLPLGYLLCFRFGYGVYGLWCGLTVSLIVIAAVLLFAWKRRAQVLAFEHLIVPSEPILS
jgi:multidrug resistance protein, MATE family